MAAEPSQSDLRRQFLMEANFRFRYLSVPDSVMDIWYFDEDDPGANPFKRPKVRGYALGVEWVVRPDPENWIFYVEYVANGIREGYWDDYEDATADHTDGDWVTPQGFGVIAAGANYGQEIRARRWLSFMFGGGLGVGVFTGDLIEWNAGGTEGNTTDESDLECLPTSAAYERRLVCPDDGAKDRYPRVIPIVDLTGSVRFHFEEFGHIRIEGGFHDMLFVGTAFGAVF